LRFELGLGLGLEFIGLKYRLGLMVNRVEVWVRDLVVVKVIVGVVVKVGIGVRVGIVRRSESY